MLGVTICSYFLDGPKNVMSSSGWRFQRSQCVWNACEGHELLKGHQATHETPGIESPDDFLLCRFTDLSW